MVEQNLEGAGPASAAEVVDYVREMVRELSQIAEGAGLAQLAAALDLVDLAAREAQENAAADDAA